MNKQKKIITPYLEIRDRLSTFTIINCEHHNLLYRLIGHTAVVYECHETGQFMVFESAVGVGVRLTPMGKWLSDYNGKVFVRIPEFTHPNYAGIEKNFMPKCTLFENMNTNAAEFIKDHLGTSYPNLKTWSGKMKLILSALDLKICGRDIFTYDGDDDGIFCTMLVIMLLQYCGLFDAGAVASEWQPDNTRGFDMNMWLKNCTYGKEIQIK